MITRLRPQVSKTSQRRDFPFSFSQCLGTQTSRASSTCKKSKTSQEFRLRTLVSQCESGGTTSQQTIRLSKIILHVPTFLGRELSCDLDLHNTPRYPMNIYFELRPNVNVSCFSEENASSCRARTFVLHLLEKTRTISSIIDTKPHQKQQQLHHQQYQNTQSHSTHTSKSMMHTHLILSRPTHRYAQTTVTTMHTHMNRRAVTEFC